MPKKPPSVSLRKPPAAVDLDRAEAFVRKPEALSTGDPSTNVQTSERPNRPERSDGLKARGLPRGVVARSDGRTLRRMTLYLPDDLARRLAVHCARENHELSAFVSEAVRLRLDALER